MPPSDPNRQQIADALRAMADATEATRDPSLVDPALAAPEQVGTSRRIAARLPVPLASAVSLSGRQMRASNSWGLTLTPSLLTLGVLLLATALASRVLAEDWVVTALPGGVVVLVAATGVVLLGVAALNILADAGRPAQTRTDPRGRA